MQFRRLIYTALGQPTKKKNPHFFLSVQVKLRLKRSILVIGSLFMGSLPDLVVVLEEVYQNNVVTVLETLLLVPTSAWIGALALLVLKLSWAPLDKATTYGKLRSSDSRIKSEDNEDSNSETEESTPPAPKPSPEPETPSSWLTQRFAFTSSYLIGYCLAISLVIFLFVYFVALGDAALVEPSSPCAPLLVSYQRETHSRYDPHWTERTAKIVNEPNSGFSSESSIFNDVNSIGLESNTRYYQSICSIWRTWTNSSKNLFSENTATDMVLLAVSNASMLRAIILSGLVVFHLGRRLLECLFVHSFSPRSISLYNVLLMWAFYVAMPIALIVDAALEFTRGTLNPTYAPYSIKTIVSLGCAIEIYIVGSVMQYAAHKILAEGRNAQTGAIKKRYIVPTDGPFEYISSPHYLAECFIYLSFAIVSGGTIVSLLIFTFVLITMVSQAAKTHAWYKANFSAQKLGKRKILIPFIW